jgi:hypothetical protein
MKLWCFIKNKLSVTEISLLSWKLVLFLNFIINYYSLHELVVLYFEIWFFILIHAKTFFLYSLSPNDITMKLRVKLQGFRKMMVNGCYFQ